MTQHQTTPRRLSTRHRLLAVSWAVVAFAGFGTVAVAGSPSSSAEHCFSALAHKSLVAGSAAQRACVIAVASTYLDAVQHTLRPDRVLLDPAVADHALGTAPVHAAGNDKVSRAAITKEATRKLDGRDWTVDGGEAVVVATGHRGTSAVAYTEMLRFTLRGGRIWEVLHDRQAGTPAGGGFPNTPVVAVLGPPAASERVGNPDDPTWCSDALARSGDRSMTAASHRRCMIAIATTYINGEENSAPGNQILFDPRVSRFSLGGKPTHHTSNSDLLRTQEGTFQGTYNRVIRSIINRHWTVDGNKLWIVYDGMLVTSVTHPQFHVAERFEIRNGLIWEIMIAPVVTTIP
jgi:hypothetical protein